MSSPLTMQYLQASGGGLSLERLLEVAHATGELVLTCRNLKSFPKHRCKNDLKDTVSVGKQNFCVFICIRLKSVLVEGLVPKEAVDSC